MSSSTRWITLLRGGLVVLAGVATVLVLVIGTVMLFAPSWTQPGGFPDTTRGLTGLLVLEVVAGTAGALVATLLAQRAPRLHGAILGLLVFVLNVWTVAGPESPWPLIPGVLLLVCVPVQTWWGIALGVRVRPSGV